MIAVDFTVFIVDDDPGVLKALTRLVRSAGCEVQAFASPAEFLAHHDPTKPGCAVFDVALPGLDGLQLQEAITADGCHRPVIFITGRGDIPTTVRAMKAGAVDFLTKPVSDDELMAAIARARKRDAKEREAYQEVAAIRLRLATLTPREREVLTHVIAGQLNKQIADELGTVEKTIKVHRGRMMAKMGARTVAHLVRMAGKLGIYSDNEPA
jgi:FixJ family two-component response regulator